MAESTEMRLVRCPKCGNVLPELADYSIYKCGGCGAVLRAAENKNRESDALWEMSDEEKMAGVAAKLQNSVEEGIVDSSDVSNSDFKLNDGSLRSEDKGPEKSHDIGCADRCKHQSSASTSGQWVIENDREMNGNIDGLSNEVERRNGDLNSQLGETSGCVRPGKRLSWQLPERCKMKGFRRIIGSEIEDVRFSNLNYPDEGPSNCNFDDSYNFGEPFSNRDNHDEPNRVQYLEKDRVELLRKLDELKEQLSRSCSVADQTKDKGRHSGSMASTGPYGGSNFWFPGVSSLSDRDSMQFLGPDKHEVGPRYCSHHPDPFLYNDGNGMAMHGLHPSPHKSNYIPGYGHPFVPQTIRRVSHQLPAQCQQPPAHYVSRHYFEPQASNAKFHLPSCSCFHCYDKHHGVPPAPLCHRRFPDVSNDHMHHHEYPGAFGAHASYSRAAGPQSHSRWSSDLNSKMRGFVLSNPQRVVLANSGRCCRPIAGGAPFFTCFNCFELLQLPKKLLVMSKNHQKIRCGACSTVINLAVVNKKLVLSVNSESMLVPAEMDDSSNEIMEPINANFSSDDCDDSIYDFRTIDANPIVSSAGQDFNSSNPEEIQRFHSSSSSTSDGENSLDILIAPRKVTNSTPSPPACGSPPVKHFVSSDNQVGNHLGKGNQSCRMDQEKVSPSKAIIRQNAMKETATATEMVVPFHEYCNAGVSQDSGAGSRENNQLKINKGGESFLTNIIKRSFKDFSIFNQADGRGRNNVSVNGHIIPNRLVKKAEKQAGPIHPGQYWYDFQAGFWGVMGGPCLGIIPPFIEELTYSMPTNCSGGNTGVFVNRRELHQKDLDLLVTRGLPTERNRYYAVDISGRVLDEDTGEELDSLGRLAPTVEKVKHGFGMKVPSTMDSAS